MSYLWRKMPWFKWFFTGTLNKNDVGFVSDQRIGQIYIPILIMHAKVSFFFVKLNFTRFSPVYEYNRLTQFFQIYFRMILQFHMCWVKNFTKLPWLNVLLMLNQLILLVLSLILDWLIFSYIPLQKHQALYSEYYLYFKNNFEKK